MTRISPSRRYLVIMAEPTIRPRKRGLTAAMHAYLVERGKPASIKEITAAIAPDFPNPPSSSVRGCLQNENYFERVQRGVFKAR
jgi:hypothetical protein